MNLKFLTDNPLIKNLALGKLKEAFKESETTLITVSYDAATDDLKFDTYDVPVKVVSESKLNELIGRIPQQ